MKQDIRHSEIYKEVEDFYRRVRRPGTGHISDANELHVSPDGRQAVFAGALMDTLASEPATRICLTTLCTGDTRVLTYGPNTDRLPKFSPDGRHVAFLSDRVRLGSFQLYILDPMRGGAHSAPEVDGWVEYLRWSPDGRRILIGVAGHGADTAGGQGAISSTRVSAEVPSWMPRVETGKEDYRWRRVWLYELETDSVRQMSHYEGNVWEAVWCGNDAIAVVASSAPDEGCWYSATLEVIQLAGGAARTLYKPRDQLGGVASSPSGTRLCVIEALCSDRGIIAGELRLLETLSGDVRAVDTQGVDVSYAEWRTEGLLLVSGHRGFESVIGLCDITKGLFTEVWRSEEISTGGFYVTVSGVNDRGDCVLIGESFLRAPEIALIQSGDYKAVTDFDRGIYHDQAKVIGRIERVRWPAPDDLEITGWVLRPDRAGPHPLVMIIHGGPVWHWRPTWLGRRTASVILLLKRGYAVFLPNPRGSSGRGQDFCRRVLGDIGGADTYDYLSGLDYLVREGIADPKRLGVIGGSYGGFMTAWLIGCDSRFAAAITVAPHTNQVTEHLLSNISHFVEMFLADRYNNPSGKYFDRSPVMRAHNVKTPTLNICGALDRCTPPEEAMQFHNALVLNGTESVLVVYPEEGHGVRKWPATVDYAARIVDWFDRHILAPSSPALGLHELRNSQPKRDERDT